MEIGFNDYNELVDVVRRGGEVEFLYNGAAYSILPIESGILVLKQYDEDSEKVFDRAEYIGEYQIGGHSLRSIL